MFKSKPKNKLTKRSKSEKSSKLTKVRKPPQPVQPVQNWVAGSSVGRGQPGATLLGGTRVDRSTDSESDDTGPTITTAPRVAPSGDGSPRITIRPDDSSESEDASDTTTTTTVRAVPPPVSAWARATPGRPPIVATARLDLTNLRTDRGGMMGLYADAGPHVDKVDLLLDVLVSRGITTMTRAQLVGTIQRNGSLYDQIASGAKIDRTGGIALEAYETQQARDGLTALLRKPNRLGSVLPGQARSLHTFLQGAPGFVRYLAAEGIKFRFTSGKAGQTGEGQFEPRTKMLHLGDLGQESPDVFLKLFLHEAGHATLQRRLLEYDKLPNETFPESWDKGLIPSLRRERTLLLEAAAQAGLSPDEPPFSMRLQEIDDTLAAEKPDDLWKLLLPETQKLYTAWTTLRDNGGQWLLGVDLGGGRDDNQRKGYQAATFTEFIAESAMHVGTGALNGHLNKISTDPTVPPEVKRAWQDAAEVLDTESQQAIYGFPPAF